MLNNTNNTTSMQSITISNETMLQLILQFLKENNLQETFTSLQNESKISYDFISNTLEHITTNITQGNWDLVLKSLENISLTKEIMLSLYEAIILELVESKEPDIAHHFLNKLSTSISKEFRSIYQSRLDLLDKVISNELTTQSHYTINSTSREINRLRLIEALTKELIPIQPSRLMYLIGQGLIRQHEIEGIKPSNNNKEYNVFSGEYIEKTEVETSFAKTKSDLGIDMRNDGSYVNCAEYSMNGLYLATGSNDGMIELWDCDTYKYPETLSYQKEGNLLFHEDPVISLSFSQDSQLLCSGDVKGNIKLFAVQSGKSLALFPNVHSKSITAVRLSKGNSCLISSGLDGKVIVIGLKSRKVINEINAHSSFINSAVIHWGNDAYYTASADGSVKIWNVNEGQLLKTIVIDSGENDNMMTITKSVNCIKVTNDGKGFYACNQSNSVYLIENNGRIAKKFITERKGSIMSFDISPEEKWLYCIDEDNLFYTFNIEHCIIVNCIDLGKEKEILGIAVFPIISSSSSSTVAIYSNDGLLTIYK